MSKKNIDELKVQLETLKSSVSSLETKLNSEPAQCPISHSSGLCPVTSLCSTSPTPLPDVSTPLLREGGGNCDPNILAKLGPLAGLIGTWVSNRTTGFNVMPIPEATAANGFILKNFSYFEEITFSAIEGKVANRGGTDEQDSYTLFYEQRVFFSDGPQVNKLVHAENGSWLHLVMAPQLLGQVGTEPMSSPPATSPIPPQNPKMAIVKQVSVPHGNSILAMGSVNTMQGAPKIPVVSTLPVGAPDRYFSPYGSDISTNPNINPNTVLETALLNSPRVLRTHCFTVDSANHGGIENVPYIKQHMNVSRFTNDLWLEELETGELQMQYSQNISLEFIQDKNKILFPHIVANTLRKLKR